MQARVKTISFVGTRVQEIDVQIYLSNGLPIFSIVGLPDKAVAESRERIRAALCGIGLALPAQRITVNLSPADVLKEGSHYDLPVALGILAAMAMVPEDEISRYVALGELALDGRLVPVQGTLSAAIYALDQGLGLICPSANGPEAAWAKGVEIIAAPTLLSLLYHIKGTRLLEIPQPLMQEVSSLSLDMADVRGQEPAKRALEIAAAGGHNVILSGTPGSGKTMLASRLPGLLPPLEPREALDVSIIYSLAGLLEEGCLRRERPFRSPHHTASHVAMVGGGLRARPGEISLAHCGILFLDELPEFSKTSLEALRQPLESGEVTVARAHAHVTYPARIQVVAAMNPCRCGYLMVPHRACSRAPKCGRDYASRLSGPLLDRFDIFVDVSPISIEQLATMNSPQQSALESSKDIARRVAKARLRQYERQAALNATLTVVNWPETMGLTRESEAILLRAAEKMGLSARAYYRLLKVSRSIADLAESNTITPHHVVEALTFRSYEDV